LPVIHRPLYGLHGEPGCLIALAGCEPEHHNSGQEGHCADAACIDLLCALLCAEGQRVALRTL
jgi:hypothetical protein